MRHLSDTCTLPTIFDVSRMLPKNLSNAVASTVSGRIALSNFPSMKHPPRSINGRFSWSTSVDFLEQKDESQTRDEKMKSKRNTAVVSHPEPGQPDIIAI